MADFDGSTEQVEQWIKLLRQGDREARDALLACAGDRLLKLTRKMLRLSADVRRWEQTDDVFQNAMMRLYRSLEQIELVDARHFYHVAALQIRRELIDLARRYQGVHGMGATCGCSRCLRNKRTVLPLVLIRRSRPATRPSWPPGWSFISASSCCRRKSGTCFNCFGTAACRPRRRPRPCTSPRAPCDAAGKRPGWLCTMCCLGARSNCRTGFH